LVESGDVVNDLPSDQDPIPGRLIDDTDTVGCLMQIDTNHD